MKMRLLLTLAVLGLLALAGCGGGDDDASPFGAAETRPTQRIRPRRTMPPTVEVTVTREVAED